MAMFMYRVGSIFKHTRTLYVSGHSQSQCIRSYNTAEKEKHNEDPARPYSEIPGPTFRTMITTGFFSSNVIKNLHKYHGELKTKYGDIVKVGVPGFGDQLFLYSPDDGESLLRHDGIMPIIPSFEPLGYYRKFIRKDLFPDPGLLCQGEDWLKFRKAVQQDMMRPKSAMYYIKDIEEISEEFISLLLNEKKENGDIVVSGSTHKWALEATACIFLGTRLGCLNTVENSSSDAKPMLENIIKMFDSAFKIALWPAVWKYGIKPPYFKKFDQAMESIISLSAKYIEKSISEVTPDSESIIAKLVNKHGKDSYIPLIMAIDALSAGADTTGHTSSFLLYHLASNPEKQELLYQEICQNIGSSNHVTESGLNNMGYLKACLRESQRLLPVVIGTSRRTQVDMVLGGYKVPSGTFVIRFGQIQSNDPTIFKDPQDFRPERWLRGCPEQAKIHPFASLPWGNGPRQCIGMRFAQMELFVLTIKLLQKYKLQYHGPPVDTQTDFISKPSVDVALKFIDRV